MRKESEGPRRLQGRQKKVPVSIVENLRPREAKGCGKQSTGKE